MRDIINKVLWSTIEDFVGLWEILWELNSVLHEKSQKENLVIARKILRYFLEQNLVICYVNKWGSDELEEIGFSGALKLLEDEKYWNAPGIDELCIKVGNTEQGKKFYQEGRAGDFIE